MPADDPQPGETWRDKRHGDVCCVKSRHPELIGPMVWYGDIGLGQALVAFLKRWEFVSGATDAR